MPVETGTVVKNLCHLQLYSFKFEVKNIKYRLVHMAELVVKNLNTVRSAVRTRLPVALLFAIHHICFIMRLYAVHRIIDAKLANSYIS